MPRRRMICACLVFLLHLPVIARAADEPPLNPDQIQEVITGLADLIAEKYVDPSLAEQVAAMLRQQLAAGEYDTHRAPRDLAGALTLALKPHDPHFFVDWNPPGSPGMSGGHSEEEEAAWLAYARREGFGFRRVEILPGNVGYLDLRFFASVRHAAESAMAAMRLLAYSDAVIIDLRHNGGGEPGMVQLLASYFLGPEPVYYNSFYEREGERIQQFWTLAYVGGPRLLDTPLYILTSPRTGSAAEGFSYALQAQERATIVGQATAGAANPGQGFPLSHGFTVFVSTGKPVNPVTSSNWADGGVRPDLEVPASVAFDTAQVEILRRLAAAASSPEARKSLDWALEAVERGAHPATLTAAQLEAYAGTYGDRRIRFTGDHLTYQRGQRTVYPLLALGEDRFLARGKEGFRLQFERDDSGAIVRLLDMWSDGHIEANGRAKEE